MKILVIDSNHDEVTKLSYIYRDKHVYPYLESKGFELIRCQGQSARRIHVEQEACRDDVVYITGVGHGTYEEYTGQNSDSIFAIDNYQCEEPRNKIVHFFACQTAAKLGPDFVSHGCLAYFGYDEDFVFNKNFSDAFFECDSEIDRAFAEGLTAEAVYERVIERFNKKICELESGKHYDAAVALAYNRDHLCAPSVDLKWGDKNAKLVDPSS